MNETNDTVWYAMSAALVLGVLLCIPVHYWMTKPDATPVVSAVLMEAPPPLAPSPVSVPSSFVPWETDILAGGWDVRSMGNTEGTCYYLISKPGVGAVVHSRRCNP